MSQDLKKCGDSGNFNFAMKGIIHRQKLKKTTFAEEQRMKDLEFLKLKPAERLRLHEVMRKRIWGDQYGKLSLKGLKVKKRNFT